MKSKTLFNLWTALGLMVALGLGIVWLSGGALAQGPSPQGTSLGTAFTYQGRLTDSNNGQPIAGPCSLKFTLYESATGDDPVGTPQIESVTPDDGYFSVELDFGATAFNGGGRFLKIEVDCGSGYTALDPRVELTPAPYAFHSVSTGALWGYRVSDSAPLVGGVLAWDGNSWMPTAVGSGSTWSLTGNSGTTAGTNFLGTSDDQALELHVNGVRALRLEPDSNSPNVIGGHSDNSVAAGVYGATIGGGGRGGGLANEVSGHAGTVGGGLDNTSSGESATIGGGERNAASGVIATVGGGETNAASGGSATVGGGLVNAASGYQATVGGGQRNTASGYQATISGGSANTASAYFATVAGGVDNAASGDGATVAGGVDNAASGQYATVGGGWDNTASGDRATVPGGQAAAAPLYGQWAYASGKFNHPGDAQASLYVMRSQTVSSGTWEDLELGDNSELLTLPPTRTLTFDILVVGRSDTAGGNESAGYYCWGVIENVGGTMTIWGSGSCVTLGEDDAAWDAQVIADDTNDALAVQVRGNGESIRWVATVRTAEVAW